MMPNDELQQRIHQQIVSPLAQTYQQVAGVPAQHPAQQPPPQQQPQQQPQVDQRKLNWIQQAKQSNPSVDNSVLSQIYDQKVAPAAALGRDPWETPEDAQKRETKEGYQEIKNNLQPPNTGEGQSLFLGLKRGLFDIGEGAKQLEYYVREKHPEFARHVTDMVMPGLSEVLLHPVPEGTTKDYTDKVNKEINQYEEQTKAHPLMSGTGRLIGNIIASLPLGDAGIAGETIEKPLLSSVLRGASQGATIGGLEFDPTGNNRALRATIGSVIGAGATGSSFYGSKLLLKWLKGTPVLLDDPAVIEEAANRVKDAKALGLDQLTAGAATQLPTIQRVESQMLKAEGPGADLFRQEHQKISNQIYDAGQKMIRAVGGMPVADEVMGRTMRDIGGNTQDALNTLYNKTNEAIGGMYDAAAEAPGWATQVDRNGVLDAHKNIADDYIDIKFSPFVTRHLNNLADVNEYGTYTNPFSVKDANDLIRGLNKSYRNTTQPDYRSAILHLKSSIFDSLDKLAEDKNNPSATLFNMARQFRRELGNVYSNSSIVNTIMKTKGQYTNYLRPEDVSTKLFGTKTKISDLNDVEKALTYVAPVDKWIKEAQRLNPKTSTTQLQQIYENNVLPQAARGKQLWDELRSLKFNDIINKSTVKYPNSMPELNYQKLTRELNNLGRPALEKLLGTKELAEQFDKLRSTMAAFQAKPATNLNVTRAGTALKRMADHIYTTIGRGMEEPGGRLGALTFPLPIVGNILRHIADEGWVNSNLRLGAQAEPVYSQLIKKEPELISTMVSKLAALGTLQPQNLTALNNYEGGAQ
jgi:hypothetical protein